MARDASAVRTEYARLAARYDRTWAAYVRRSTAETLRRLAPRAGERVLDVGCGTGALLAAARDAVGGPGSPGAGGVAVGADLTVAMLAVARARLGPGVPLGPLVAADALALPFADAAFDAVVSASALHYWPSAAAGVAECARVLRPGGRLVVTDWCADFRTVRLLDRVLRVVDPAHGPPLTGAACAGLFAAAGLGEVRVARYRISWWWGLMTVTGRRPQLTAERP